jgi:hypothetical protein
MHLNEAVVKRKQSKHPGDLIVCDKTTHNGGNEKDDCGIKHTAMILYISSQE